MNASLLGLQGPCDPASAGALAAYLETDRNAAWAARELRAGKVIAWRATVPDRDALGRLNIGFEVLGKVRAADVSRRRYFRVSEAREQWKRGAADDRDAYEQLERYISEVPTRLGIRNRTITLRHDANGRRIIDGNKRAIALFEAGGDEVVLLPVYVLFPAGAEPELE